MLVMGILNVAPDSFYDGGRWSSVGDAVDFGLQMAADGADIIDVGGESSRPGARVVSVEEELDRVIPVVEGLSARCDLPLSVDTTKARVADAAIAAGASIVNDISALRFDEGLGEVVARRQAWVVLMHMQGEPGTMQREPRYDDPVGEIRTFLEERMEIAERAGIGRRRMIVDPGIGFGKTLDHNLALLAGLRCFVGLGAPLLVGLSRKSFLERLLGLPAEERLVGTVAANAVAIAHGADIIRVHDVREGRWTADVAYSARCSVR
ncbi:MAG: dihydropteroate synthase [Candidatus Bipolaricaulota bacterium]|nr:MAG: dihydropteroate synthase [Candidatus Bipolaricaulota bacterium]